MLALLQPLLVVALACVTMSACVAPGSGETGPPLGVVTAIGCAGEAPASVMGCSTGAYMDRAVCESGIWHCDHGIRDDLCCDPVFQPEQCPEWGETCAPGAPCSDGYTCVVSRSWPLPTDEGICHLGDWTIPEPLASCAGDDVIQGRHLFDIGPAAIKLEGIVVVEPSCDDRRCSNDNPCCQRCTGSYALDLADVGQSPMEVSLRTETLSCAGTNCGFTCSPLQPGRRYRIWGLWLPDDGGAAPGALYVAGYCDD
jgi:hypothetical protein